MTPTAVPDREMPPPCCCPLHGSDCCTSHTPDPRLLRALRLLTVRAAQPADEGADRAVVRAAVRRLRGC